MPTTTSGTHTGPQSLTVSPFTASTVKTVVRELFPGLRSTGSLGGEASVSLVQIPQPVMPDCVAWPRLRSDVLVPDKCL